jgi:zinc transporter ZupT
MIHRKTKYLLLIFILVIIAYASNTSNEQHPEIGKVSIIHEMHAKFNEYDYKTQAIIATLIVQSVPVIIMSVVYSCLAKGVRNPKESLMLQIMYAFTFGSLMGDVFFHIFPSLNEEFTRGGEVYDKDQQIYVHYFFIGGMVICYLLEVVINKLFGGDSDSHGEDKEEDEDKKSAAVTVALLGDLFHNFTDGLAIASTYTLNPKVGFVTALACFVHEFPHEIGDFAYLYKNGYSYFQALSYQLITGCGAVVGALVSLTFSGDATVEMVAISGGAFTYMSLLLFLEDIRHGKRIDWAIINIIFIFLGLYCMQLVAVLEE